jgi:pyrroline-5-carboxylate reductase
MINKFINKQITFIGGGKMTTSMIQNILNKNILSPSQIIVSNRNEKKNSFFQNNLGIKTITNNYDACLNSDIIMIAVKPQSLENVMTNIKNIENKLILSVIAGIPLKTYKNNLNSQKIVRIMPNTPTIIGEGMSVWSSLNLNDTDLSLTKDLLKSFGKEMYVDNENYLDIATAISGTGPTYLYLLAESMIDSGVHLGLSRDKAEELVHQTLLGSAKHLIQSNTHPAILRNHITSPGGTSAEAIAVLEKNGLRSNLSEAIWAAYHRSVELGKIHDK